MIVTCYREVMAVGSQSDARDEATSPRVIKHIEMHVVGSRLDALDAFSIDLISTVITHCDQRLRLYSIR